MTPAEWRARITAEIVKRTGIDEGDDHMLGAGLLWQGAQGHPAGAGVRGTDRGLGGSPAAHGHLLVVGRADEGRYHGQPMEKHLLLPVDARHFDRWLALFEETAPDVCPPAAAAHFIERARRIAESLELGIAGQHGILLMKGERLRRPDRDVFLPHDVGGEMGLTA